MPMPMPTSRYRHGGVFDPFGNRTLRCLQHGLRRQGIRHWGSFSAKRVVGSPAICVDLMERNCGAYSSETVSALGRPGMLAIEYGQENLRHFKGDLWRERTRIFTSWPLVCLRNPTSCHKFKLVPYRVDDGGSVAPWPWRYTGEVRVRVITPVETRTALQRPHSRICHGHPTAAQSREPCC